MFAIRNLDNYRKFEMDIEYKLMGIMSFIMAHKDVAWFFRL